MTASYPATEVWKVIETSEVVVGGGAVFQDDCQLAQVIVTLFKSGVAAGTERLRARLYHDAACTKLYATSEWTTLADTWGAAPGAYWRGRVPLNFATTGRPFIEAGETYYVAFDADGYTRNGETFWLGLSYDWPLPVNDNASALAMVFIVQMGVRA